MNNTLQLLIEKNNKLLSKLNISVDEIKNTELDFKDNAEQVDLIGETTLARITLFDNNRLYIQILNISTEETIYFFDDMFDEKSNLEDFIIKTIKRMSRTS